VVEVANANMQRALRLVSVQRGYDLREFTLIAYGGAGPVHAGALAREAGIARIVVPAHSGAFSALGCLVSPLRYDAVQTHRMRLEAWDGKVVADRLRGLEAQCLTPLLAEGHSAERVLLKRSADLRYAGQNYELEVDYGAGTPEALRDVFERRHRQLYGYATGESVECINLRVSAQLVRDDLTLGSSTATGTAAPVGELRAFFRGAGAVTMPRYERGSLPPGQMVAGPALVEDEWSTTLVYPGQRCRADRLGNLLIEVAP
jgi:N-methylhydantoinase A